MLPNNTGRMQKEVFLNGEIKVPWRISWPGLMAVGENEIQRMDICKLIILGKMA